MKKLNHTVGIDIGGTSIKWGLVSEEGQVIGKNSVPTKKFGTFVEFADEMSANITELLKTYPDIQVSAIGIGAPNGNQHTGCIENPVNIPWKGISPATELFTKKLNLPVGLTNDANAFAIGEKIFGKAKKMNDFVMLTLGTGLGSGIFTNGKLLIGKTGMAGELGHVTAIPDGRKCTCGRYGCLEEYVSARGIKSNAKQISENENIELDERFFRNGDLSLEKISELSAQNDQFAQHILRYSGKILGMAIADFYAVFSPEAIFIAGGISNIDKVFFDSAKENAQKYSLNFYKNDINIIKSELGSDTAGILGAAALAFSM